MSELASEYILRECILRSEAKSVTEHGAECPESLGVDN